MCVGGGGGIKCGSKGKEMGNRGMLYYRFSAISCEFVLFIMSCVVHLAKNCVVY